MDIDAAMEKAAAQLDGASTSTEAPVAGEAAATPAPASGESSSTPPPAEAAPSAPRAGRDEHGRFTTKAPAAPAEAPTPEAAAKAADGAAAPPPPSAVAPAVEPKFKPPQSWKPLVREKWAALPPEVQEEIARREAEVPKALEQAAQARRFQEAVTETLRPYEMLARAAGQHPVQYAAGLMQTAAALQTGAPGQRAAVVANIIRQFGVDVEQLAAELDRAPGQQPAQHQPQADPRAIVREEFQRLQGESLQRSAQKYAQDFASRFEFGGDSRVRSLAAAIIESEAHNGVEVSAEDAYNRAVVAIPEFREVLDGRKAKEAAAKANADAQRSQAAAVSIKSRSAAPMSAQSKGLDGAIEAARQKLGM